MKKTYIFHLALNLMKNMVIDVVNFDTFISTAAVDINRGCHSDFTVSKTFPSKTSLFLLGVCPVTCLCKNKCLLDGFAKGLTNMNCHTYCFAGLYPLQVDTGSQASWPGCLYWCYLTNNYTPIPEFLHSQTAADKACLVYP